MTPAHPGPPNKKVSAVFFPLRTVLSSYSASSPSMPSPRDLGLLRRACHHEQEASEVSRYNNFFWSGDSPPLKRHFFLYWHPSIDIQSLGSTAAGTVPDHTVDGRPAASPGTLTTRLRQNTLSRLQRRLPVLSGSAATERRFSPRVGLFTQETL